MRHILIVFVSLFACQQTVQAHVCDNSLVVTFYTDYALLDTLKRQGDLDTKFTPSCLGAMVETNLFDSLNYALDFYDGKRINSMLASFEVYSESVIEEYDTLLAKIKAWKEKAIVVPPPFNWYQDLNRIHIEVKAAYRFDVAGCATLFNETIDITAKSFYVSVSCAESQETKINYLLQFDFWNEINEDSVVFQRKPVGKFVFTIDKAKKPGRWRQLFKEGTPKPSTMKLDIDKH